MFYEYLIKMVLSSVMWGSDLRENKQEKVKNNTEMMMSAVLTWNTKEPEGWTGTETKNVFACFLIIYWTLLLSDCSLKTNI